MLAVWLLGAFAGLGGNGLEKTLESWRQQPWELARDGEMGSDVRTQQEVQALAEPRHTNFSFSLQMFESEVKSDSGSVISDSL